MGSFTVVFSKSASCDLERIVYRIAQDDPRRAESFGLELTNEAFALQDPTVAKNLREFSNKKGIRRLVYGKYLIVFRIIESQNKVRILKFWHGSRDRVKISDL